MTQSKVCLIAIDGWGVNEPVPEKPLQGDAIANASTPVMTRLASGDKTVDSLYTTIAAHGLSVGLPQGLMGNSEVGHLNIGAGRIVYQDIVRIDLAVKKNTLKDAPALKKAFDNAKQKSGGRIHFLGLVSDGGVHSHMNHLKCLLRSAKDAGIRDAYVHFFADGRDTSPKSAVGYLKDLLNYMKQDLGGYGQIATIEGRYYAMDRDKRWERIKLAYDAIVAGVGESTTDPVHLIEVDRYENAQETDEFLKPIIVNRDGCVKDDDTLIFFNYRSDRMRQIMQVFGKLFGDSKQEQAQYPFEMEHERSGLHIITMTQYKADFPYEVMFPPQKMTNVLSEVIAQNKLPQLHVAETEKYAHVTFFFNGGTEKQYAGEDRLMVPSPKGVATYDLKPEMSSIEVGEAVARALRDGRAASYADGQMFASAPTPLSFNKEDSATTDGRELYPFVMCNFAAPDMVGHTGKYEPALKAIEATDKAIGIIYEACKENGYVLIITADHGNAEKMVAEDGTPHTAHTCARVPLIIANFKASSLLQQPAKLKGGLGFKSDGGEGESVVETGGALCDVGPTILKIMGLTQPEEMTGESLLE
ncbi:hypothetical protein MIR68_000838 [Amoeboaphelidium protococcarum]|nr:hypothetical protein MIR68_000838 [Amoeboaphelidium protococcarum]